MLKEYFFYYAEEFGRIINKVNAMCMIIKINLKVMEDEKVIMKSF